MNGKPATDAEIEAALAKTDLTPELCSWYDGSYGCVVFRIETHIGHYAERDISPWAGHDGIVHTIEATRRDHDARPWRVNDD